MSEWKNHFKKTLFLRRVSGLAYLFFGIGFPLSTHSFTHRFFEAARADFSDDWQLNPTPSKNKLPPAQEPKEVKDVTLPVPSAPLNSDTTLNHSTDSAPGHQRKEGEKSLKNPTSRSPGLFGDDVSQFDSKAPLKIVNADELEGSQRSGFLVLTGRVHLAQADTTIKSDKAHIFFESQTRQAYKAVAKGNVKIQKKPSEKVPSLYAQADEIEFFVRTRKAILKGRPKIWRGDEVMQGQVMELDLNTGQVRVRGVSGLIDPQKSSNSKGTK